MSTLLRQHAEQQFAEELHELKKNETNSVPEKLGNVSAIGSHLPDGGQTEERI